MQFSCARNKVTSCQIQNTLCNTLGAITIHIVSAFNFRFICGVVCYSKFAAVILVSMCCLRNMRTVQLKGNTSQSRPCVLEDCKIKILELSKAYVRCEGPLPNEGFLGQGDCICYSDLLREEEYILACLQEDV